MSEKRLIVGSRAMQALAAELAGKFEAGDTILLQGELGAGKTTFVQGIAQALGVSGEVTSPTYTIVAEYSTTTSDHISTLVHVDLYRLQEAEAVRDPAVQDVLSRMSEGSRLTLIEWPERLGSHEPTAAWRILFQHGERIDERAVQIEQLSARP